jgi:hypothetical protein
MLPESSYLFGEAGGKQRSTCNVDIMSLSSAEARCPCTSVVALDGNPVPIPVEVPVVAGSSPRVRGTL